ncbi:MAG TPA: glutamine amidotransferase [Spirochaetia bacterium]|nr:glutamine amidotransferase [Spirochaetia bacterium]
MYPDLLNLYGDRGNVITLVQRLRWRHLPVEVTEVALGGKADFEAMDILFLGGGSDREQGLMAEDLMSRRAELGRAIEAGVVVLAICGGYQMLGHFYRTAEGREIPALSLLDLHTVAGPRRMIGNVAVELELPEGKVQAVGFENHSGRTFLGKGVRPLGRVVAGNGNNGADGWEGARYRNVFCSYLHGPLLPKNPRLADHLLELCLLRRGEGQTLPPLDDGLENLANRVMYERLTRTGEKSRSSKR